jgi:hypothetical protein
MNTRETPWTGMRRHPCFEFARISSYPEQAGANLQHSPHLIISLLVWCLAIPLGILSRHGSVGAAFQVTLLNFGFTGLLGLFLVAGSGEYARMAQIKDSTISGLHELRLVSIPLFLPRVYDGVVAEHWHYVQRTGDTGHLLVRMTVVGAVSVTLAHLS